MLHQMKRDGFYAVSFHFLHYITGGENPRGRERKREYPVDIRAASGPQATGPGAKEEARKRSDAGGRAPYAPPNKMRRSFDRLVLFFEFFWGENPGGRECRREYPVDIRKMSGPRAVYRPPRRKHASKAMRAPGPLCSDTPYSRVLR